MSDVEALLEALNVALVGLSNSEDRLDDIDEYAGGDNERHVRECVLELVCDGAGYVTCERCPRVGTQEDVVDVDGVPLCAKCRGGECYNAFCGREAGLDPPQDWQPEEDVQ